MYQHEIESKLVGGTTCESTQHVNKMSRLEKDQRDEYVRGRGVGLSPSVQGDGLSFSAVFVYIQYGRHGI
jgi:hypothetical protein